MPRGCKILLKICHALVHGCQKQAMLLRIDLSGDVNVTECYVTTVGHANVGLLLLLLTIVDFVCD